MGDIDRLFQADEVLRLRDDGVILVRMPIGDNVLQILPDEEAMSNARAGEAWFSIQKDFSFDDAVQGGRWVLILEWLNGREDGPVYVVVKRVFDQKSGPFNHYSYDTWTCASNVLWSDFVRWLARL